MRLEEISMKHMRQFLIILFFTFIGEVLHQFIPLPIPSSIYGLVLLFIALTHGIFKVNEVHDTADFLIDIMPIMFIPAAVGLIQSTTSIKPILIQSIIIMMISTVVVMAITGKVSMLLRKEDSNFE
jgi:Putative effector of murein hydrolase LrgA